MQKRLPCKTFNLKKDTGYVFQAHYLNIRSNPDLQTLKELVVQGIRNTVSVYLSVFELGL